MNQLRIAPFALLAAVCATTAVAQGAAQGVARGMAQGAGETEQPPVLRASQWLPAELLSGPNHRVGEKVANDGYMNHYAISSRFGDLDAHSTAELGIRVSELNALAEMEKVSSARQLQSGLEDSADSLIQGVGAFLADPVRGVENTASGVNKLFGRLKEAGDEDQDDLLGFDRAKRHVATEYDVDPYTSNPLVQAELDRLAQAQASGGIVLTGAMAPVGGAAGIALTATSATTRLTEMLRDKSVADLQKINAQKLAAMGVGQDVIDLFIEAPELSPSHQTAIVTVLEGMDGVAGRELLVKQAVHTSGEDVALFRVRQVSMYLVYHNKTARLTRFVDAGNRIVGAIDVNGNAVVALPVDLLAWTPEVSGIAAAARAPLEGGTAPAAGRRLLLTGSATPLARNAMEASGWSMSEKFSLDDR